MSAVAHAKQKKATTRLPTSKPEPETEKAFKVVGSKPVSGRPHKRLGTPLGLMFSPETLAKRYAVIILPRMEVVAVGQPIELATTYADSFNEQSAVIGHFAVIARLPDCVMQAEQENASKQQRIASYVNYLEERIARLTVGRRVSAR